MKNCENCLEEVKDCKCGETKCFTTDGDGYIVCPYCGSEKDIDSETDRDMDEYEYDCDECGNTYDISPYCSWSWTTTRKTEGNKA